MHGSSNSDIKRQLYWWAVAWLLFGVVIVALGYQSDEPDSLLYATMAARMSNLPLSEWIAPEWWGLWDRGGLFREHPIGIFILPALLAMGGFPALQAGYFVNAGYQIASIFLFQRLGRAFVPDLEARALGWILPILPVASMTRVRANHEPALLLCLLLALFATYRARGNAAWIVLTVLATACGVLIKGVLVVFVPLSCILLLWVLRGIRDGARTSWIVPWLGVAAGIVACVLLVFGYEWAYHQATGESFIGFYVGRWTEAATIEHESWPPPFEQLSNAAWYLRRFLWYAFPWSVALLVLCWKRPRDLVRRLLAPATAPHDESDLPLRGAVLGMGIGLMYMGALSISSRTMIRYAFPALYVIGATSGLISVHGSERLRRFAARIDPQLPPVQALLWLVLAVGAVLLG